MHPFYGPSARFLAGRESQLTGLVSMAAYLAFWAGAVAIGIRMVNDRLPRGGPAEPVPVADEAVAVLRRRYGAGDIDRDEYLQVLADLQPAPAAAVPAPGEVPG